MKQFFIALTISILVLVLSHVSTTIWGDKPEVINIPAEFTTAPQETVSDFTYRYALTPELINKVFPHATPEAAMPTLTSEKEEQLKEAIALEQEHATKNWMKIFPKFLLWFAFLGFMLWTLTRKKLNRNKRILYYGTGVTIFGIILGADPSPMGTVKDAIVLAGESGAIFPPRMIAFVVLTLLVIVAHKFICSWGCQFGVFQDLLFRLGRDKKDEKGAIPQFKVPFIISNSIRILTFIGLFIAAFGFSFDLLGSIDPFKTFKPAMIGLTGGIFLALILIASIFTYRPWCHFFCPFGLTGWVFEHISWFRIRVNKETCIDCKKCEEVCPSHAMEGILRNKKIRADCFSCGNCISSCPVNAVTFSKKNLNKNKTNED